MDIKSHRAWSLDVSLVYLSPVDTPAACFRVLDPTLLFFILWFDILSNGLPLTAALDTSEPHCCRPQHPSPHHPQTHGPALRRHTESGLKLSFLRALALSNSLELEKAFFPSVIHIIEAFLTTQ